MREHASHTRDAFNVAVVNKRLLDRLSHDVLSCYVSAYY
jgi:hypothetical protein